MRKSRSDEWANGTEISGNLNHKVANVRARSRALNMGCSGATNGADFFGEEGDTDIYNLLIERNQAVEKIWTEWKERWEMSCWTVSPPIDPPAIVHSFESCLTPVVDTNTSTQATLYDSPAAIGAANAFSFAGISTSVAAEKKPKSLAAKAKAKALAAKENLQAIRYHLHHQEDVKPKEFFLEVKFDKVNAREAAGALTRAVMQWRLADKKSVNGGELGTVVMQEDVRLTS
jgi:hypothetical protein